MIRRVLNIYDYIQTNSRSQNKTQKRLQAKNYKKICKNCQFRETFVDDSGKDIFVYHCKLRQKQIKLEENCPEFMLYPNT